MYQEPWVQILPVFQETTFSESLISQMTVVVVVIVVTVTVAHFRGCSEE
jgi:hypothetical protein